MRLIRLKNRDHNLKIWISRWASLIRLYLLSFHSREINDFGRGMISLHQSLHPSTSTWVDPRENFISIFMVIIPSTDGSLLAAYLNISLGEVNVTRFNHEFPTHVQPKLETQIKKERKKSAIALSDNACFA